MTKQLNFPELQCPGTGLFDETKRADNESFPLILDGKIETVISLTCRELTSVNLCRPSWYRSFRTCRTFKTARRALREPNRVYK